jgi:hypothetical protein
LNLEYVFAISRQFRKIGLSNSSRIGVGQG